MSRLPVHDPVIAVYGPPGAGKTTLARMLADRLDRVYVSSGDLAREADPDSLSRGEMADRDKLRAAFNEALGRAIGSTRLVVVDGLPRDPHDPELLPVGETQFLLLEVHPYVAERRQLQRGRPGDEPDIISKRTKEQTVLMELDQPGGWARDLAHLTMTTDSHDPETTYDRAMRYLTLRKY